MFRRIPFKMWLCTEIIKENLKLIQKHKELKVKIKQAE